MLLRVPAGSVAAGSTTVVSVVVSGVGAVGRSVLEATEVRVPVESVAGVSVEPPSVAVGRVEVVE
jgi:hypothetical protein